METMHRLLINAERLADCRDIEADLRDIIETAIRSGYAAQEILVAVSELAAEELAPALDLPTVH